MSRFARFRRYWASLRRMAPRPAPASRPATGCRDRGTPINDFRDIANRIKRIPRKPGYHLSSRGVDQTVEVRSRAMMAAMASSRPHQGGATPVTLPDNFFVHTDFTLPPRWAERPRKRGT